MIYKTYTQVRERVKSVCEAAGFSFHDGFESKAVPAVPFPCFFTLAGSSKGDAGFSSDGSGAVFSKKCDYSVELWGEDCSLREKLSEVFGNLCGEDGFFNVKASEISLSKISRTPRAEVTFSVYESCEEKVSAAGMDKAVIAGAVIAVDSVTRKKTCFLPTVTLAGGELYTGSPAARDEELAISGKVVTAYADALRETLFSKVGSAVNIVMNGSDLGKYLLLSAEVTSESGYYASCRLTARASSGEG